MRKGFPLLLIFILAVTPTQLANANSPKAGAVCNKLGSKQTFSGKIFTCIKSGKKLVWNKGVVSKSIPSKPTPSDSNSSSQSQTPTQTPKPTPSPAPTSTVKTITYSDPSVAGDNVELCKLKEASQSRGMTGAAFPAWNTLTPSTGKVKWALIPIDFPDLKGQDNIHARVDEQMKLLSDWYSTVSEGKFNIEWVLLDKWVTLPKPSTEYSISQSVNLNNAANGPKLFKDAMDSSDPYFDFKNIQTVNFILPQGQKFLLETSQGFPWDQAVKDYVSNEGPISSYSIAGQFMDYPGKAYWGYWAHEFGHAIGLPHVGLSRGELPPFNPLDLMGGQDGPTRELSGWIRFYAQWLDDAKVFCKESKNLNSLEMTLVPLSGSDKGLKLAIIPISQTKAVLVEARRETKFSCNMPTPSNGVLVYTLDTTLGHNEDFLIPIYPSGRNLEKPTCGGVAANYTPQMRDMLLHEGQSITVDGVKVEVLLHGNMDKIRISKA